MSQGDLERARAALARSPEDDGALEEVVRAADRRFGLPGDLAVAEAALGEGRPAIPPGVREEVLARVAARQRVALGVPRVGEIGPPVPMGRWLLTEDARCLVGVDGNWAVRRRGPRWDQVETWRVPGGAGGWAVIVDARVCEEGRRLMLLRRLQAWRPEAPAGTRLDELDMGSGVWETSRSRPDDAELGDPPALWICPCMTRLLAVSEDGRRAWLEALPGTSGGRQDYQDAPGRFLRFGGFSPDGTQAALMARGTMQHSTQVVLGSLEGGALRPCGPSREIGPDRVDFSACGGFLGAWRYRRGEGSEVEGLWILDREGGVVRDRVDLPALGIQDLWLGPGARWAVARGAAGWWLDVGTGERRLLDDQATRFRRDRNEAGLALVGSGPPSLQDLSSWEAGGPRVTVSPPVSPGVHAPSSLEVSEDGRFVRGAFAHLNLQLRWDRTTGSTRESRIFSGRITGAWHVRRATLGHGVQGTKTWLEIEDDEGQLLASGGVELPPGTWSLVDAAPGPGRLLLRHGGNTRVAEVEVASWRVRWWSDLHPGRVQACGYTPGGRPYVVMGHQRRARVDFLDPDTGEEVETWWLPGAGSPWGELVADARPEGERYWLVARHKLYRLGGEGGGVAEVLGKREQEDEGVAVHPGGVGLARRRRRGVLRWEYPGEPPLEEWSLPDHLGHALAFSPEGDELYMGYPGHLRIARLGDSLRYLPGMTTSSPG